MRIHSPTRARRLLPRDQMPVKPTHRQRTRLARRTHRRPRQAARGATARRRRSPRCRSASRRYRGTASWTARGRRLGLSPRSSTRFSVFDLRLLVIDVCILLSGLYATYIYVLYFSPVPQFCARCLYPDVAFSCGPQKGVRINA
ncbi:hypothetical protein HYPSUDRAFT_85234 [Hypholoma sublateritium FD-334 SS-4]|uniref:Uncharacterized protein n=1 Tax=Hypholoma sublateritium (strain FD-334 SS-4) TaxID=945553 RepID=A0A0D2Q1Q0_HYPSF|nr:hypothetical protein HYPSUDRAFT_85234 [Hypholoma sublateritium FD-334 SS-4]